jgi:hypothetical protein
MHDWPIDTQPQGGQQCVGVLQAQSAQFLQCVGPLHLADWGGCCRRNELDRLVTEHAAESMPNHGLPQFIAVMLSCSTVASDIIRYPFPS